MFTGQGAIEELIKRFRMIIEWIREPESSTFLETRKECATKRRERVGCKNGEGKCWGVMLVKLYCYFVYMYKYVTANTINMCNFNGSIKNVEENKGRKNTS